MAKKYLDYDGLLYFWQKIKTVFVPNTRKVNGKALSADITLTASDVSALPSSTTIPSPGTGSSYPTMDGTRALGSNAGYARVDHVHPSDTTRVPTSRTINTKALSGDIVLTGSDIAANSTASTTIADALDGKVDKVSGKGLSTNDYTTTEKNKLAGIASGAEVNQNAFSNITVGDTTIEADAKTDTLTLVAGNKITLTPDATNDQVTIEFNGTIPTVPSTLLYYGQGLAVCATANDSPAKTATLGSFLLKKYGIVAVKFQEGCSIIRTLNVNSTGAKYITYLGSTTTASSDRSLSLPTNRCALFMYDGTNYVLLDYDRGNAATSRDGYMPYELYNKLNGIASGAEVNQNAFSNITVGDTTIEADAKTDTLTLAGSNVTLTPDASADKVTIGITASNVTTALGNTAVARATGDASGNNIANTYAPKASPALTGTPTAPTAAAGTNTTQIATTAFVAAAVTASGGEVNQNAFSNVKVGSTTVAADTKTDTLELAAGSNITLTPDATNDKVTIAATDTTYSDFTRPTTSAAGTHGLVPAPVVAEADSILFSDAKWYALDISRDATVLNIDRREAGQTADTEVYVELPAATATVAGVMTAADKTKLNGIASGAEVNQNAFSNVKVGSTTVAADAKTDTLELAGSNVTLTPDATNDKVTIGITASNVTTALGNTAVARATGDASGNNIANTYAPKASPTFSGTPIAPTAAAGTNTQQIATTAFVTSAVQTAITGAAAFQGTAPTSFAPTNYKKGYYWVVGTAGTYVTQTCEPGDMIFAIKDYGTAYAASDFNVIQTNLDITSIPNADIDTIVAS